MLRCRYMEGSNVAVNQPINASSGITSLPFVAVDGDNNIGSACSVVDAKRGAAPGKWWDDKVGRCKLDPSLKATCFQPLNLRMRTVLST